MNPIKPSKIIVAVIAAVVAALALAACTPPGSAGGKGSPSPSFGDHPVTIAAPPSADIGKVQVKLTGKAGDKLDIYAFDGGWDTQKAPECTVNDDPSQSVNLGPTGTETVTLSVEHPGVWWWVVSSVKAGVTSKCGASSTIATSNPEFSFGGPESPSDDLNADMAPLKVGSTINYWVMSDIDAPDNAPGWPTTVQWIGPFSSNPEARAACAKHTPVGATSKGRAKAGEPGGGGGGKFTVKLPKPGVYAVVASTPGGKWNTPVTSPCDDTTPYLVAK